MAKFVPEAEMELYSTLSGYFSVSFKKINGASTIFHVSKKIKKAAVIMEGSASGITMRTSN